jgi:hypothetical protein
VTRRRELASTVHGLYGSFISRNNDVDGYWGIGKLRLHAQEVGSNTVRFDLVDELIQPPSSDFQRLVERYHIKFLSYAASRFASSALIELNFKPTPPTERIVPMNTWGDMFRLTVTIKDDRGRVYSRDGYGYCGPHDPKRESRSAGPDRC